MWSGRAAVRAARQDRKKERLDKPFVSAGILALSQAHMEDQLAVPGNEKELGGEPTLLSGTCEVEV